MSRHEFNRVRQDVVRRNVTILEKQQLTPGMLRIVFGSEELAGFHSPSADDHIKLFLPAAKPGEYAARDFTPRAWDPTTQTLTLDFALHPQGPAVAWARSAKIGDGLEIGGPRGSTIVPEDFDWYLLMGDATALPSIGRRLQELPANAKVKVITLVDGPEELPYLAEAGDRQIAWLFSAGDLEKTASQLCDALAQLELPRGDGFIWVAAEVSVARAAYRFAINTLDHPKEWIKAAGYWSAGKAEGGERIA